METTAPMLSLPIPDGVRGLAHFSSVVGWAVFAVCAIFWLAMLVDCLRRPTFYPLLGTSWRTRIFWLLTFLFLNPLLTLIYLLFGRLLPPKPKAARPVSLAIIGIVLLIVAGQLWPSSALLPQVLQFRRDPASGEMKLESGTVSAGLGFKAAGTVSMNSHTSTSSSSGNAESLFACEHVVVLGLSEHPLMQKVAGLLCQRTGGQQFVKSVAYYPPGKLPPTGGPFPDMVVVLDAPKLSNANVPGFRELTCTIDVSAGQVPWSCRHSYMSNDSPPIFNVDYTSRIEHRTRTAGIATDDAQYQAAAVSIVEQIEGGLLKALGEWNAKHATSTGLPASFYGQYTAPKEPFFTDRPGWQVVLSGTSMFEHNRTIWRFADNRPAEEVLADIQKQLTSRGFKCEDHDAPYLRMTKQEQEVEVFQQQRPELSPVADAPDGPRPFVAVYRLRFTDAERCRAVEDLLTSATSAGQLLPFLHMLNVCPDGLEDRVLARIAELPATSARGMLAIADWHHRRGEQDSARACLRKAVTLAWADGCKSELESELKDLGGKLGIVDVAQTQPSREDLLQVGLPPLASDGKPTEGNLAIGELLRAWVLAASGDLYIIRCSVLPGEKAAEPFRLSTTIEGSSGSVTSTVGIAPTGGNGQRSWSGAESAGYNGIRIAATANSKDGKLFEVAARLLENATPASVPSAS